MTETKPVKHGRQGEGGGRPTKYNQKLADEICEYLAQGKSLARICEMEGMPAGRTVWRWLRTKKKFCQRYEKAKEESADYLAEEILDISDNGRNDYMASLDPKDKKAYMVMGEYVQRSRLRVDARKWIAARLKPKKYGDALDVTSGHKPLPAPIYGNKAAATTKT